MTIRSVSRATILLLALLACTSAWSQRALVRSADQVHVNIPAQSLSGALTEFGRETGTEVEFSPDTVRGKSAAAIEGDYERLAVIRQLLSGSGLDFRLTSDQVIVIQASSVALTPAGAASGPAPRLFSHVSANPNSSPIEGVTVEAARQRETLRKQVSAFLIAITPHAQGESLASWQIPVCPLVANLPRDVGEFILRRISQVALEANAPLAGEKCRPNLLIVVTAQPNELLHQWRRRYPLTFNETRGIAGIKAVETSSSPIRFWYNVDDGCPGSLTYGIAVNATRKNPFPFASCSRTGALGSRLVEEVVRVISSVIVVVDSERTKELGVGAFADYMALNALAEIRMTRDPGAAPTILRLLNVSNDSTPQALTAWDKAFLKALYNTYPSDSLRKSQMESIMINLLSQ